MNYRMVNPEFDFLFIYIYIMSVSWYGGICSFVASDCLCCYNGKTYALNDTIYSQTDEVGCGNAVCGPNGEIIKTFIPCNTPSAPAQGTIYTRFGGDFIKSVMVTRFLCL